MSHWQEWVVALLLLCCLYWIARRIRMFFRRMNEKNNPCANCVTGCDIKRLYDEKRSACGKNQKISKKKMLRIVGN